MALRMCKADLDQLRFHAQASYPHEACGVLLGAADGRRVCSVIGCANSCLESPQTRYSIDPAELLRIQRRAREAGQAILGFYHSHPDRLAHWSETDLREAYWTGCSYLITAVEGGKAGLTRSFLLVGDAAAKHFEDEAIELY